MASKCMSRAPEQERERVESTAIPHREVSREDTGPGARVEVKHGDRGHIVTLSGDIDLDSAEELDAQLAPVAERCRCLTLDLRQVRFLDSAGLQVILNLYRKLDEREAGLLLLEGEQGNVSYVLRSAGLERLIEP